MHASNVRFCWMFHIWDLDKLGSWCWLYRCRDIQKWTFNFKIPNVFLYFTVQSCYKVLMNTLKHTHARNIPGISSIVNKMMPSCFKILTRASATRVGSTLPPCSFYHLTTFPKHNRTCAVHVPTICNAVIWKLFHMQAFKLYGPSLSHLTVKG